MTMERKELIKNALVEAIPEFMEKHDYDDIKDLRENDMDLLNIALKNSGIELSDDERSDLEFIVRLTVMSAYMNYRIKLNENR